MTDTPTGTGDLVKRLREKRQHPCCMHSTDELDEHCQAAADALEAAERVIAQICDPMQYPDEVAIIEAAQDWLARHATGERAVEKPQGRIKDSEAWSREKDMRLMDQRLAPYTGQRKGGDDGD